MPVRWDSVFRGSREKGAAGTVGGCGEEDICTSLLFPPCHPACRVLSRILVDIRCSGEYWYATMVGIFTSWAPVITPAVFGMTIKCSSRYLNTCVLRVDICITLKI